MIIFVLEKIFASLLKQNPETYKFQTKFSLAKYKTFAVSIIYKRI